MGLNNNRDYTVCKQLIKYLATFFLYIKSILGMNEKRKKRIQIVWATLRKILQSLVISKYEPLSAR